ncbi:ArsR family transcriptional regulator [Candidatus Pacearchaeota archaeon]|nr:ArsR family transcriptional regulator [Candidatus Pacearchaeota archaeon]
MNRELKLEIFLKKSKLRQQVWSKLEKIKTASDIAKEIGKHRSAISRVLLDMEREGLVKCINPEDKSFRHYVKR